MVFVFAGFNSKPWILLKGSDVAAKSLDASKLYGLACMITLFHFWMQQDVKCLVEGSG